MFLIYRVTTPDWDFWGRLSPPAQPRAVVQVPPRTTEEAPEALAETPEGPALETEPREVAPPALAEVDPDEEVRKEAERARAQRDEIARFKEKEADRLAQQPPPRPLVPEFRGGIDPRQLDQFLRRQRAIEAEMDALMAQHFAQFDDIIRAQRDLMRRDFDHFAPGPRRGRAAPPDFGGPFPGFGAGDPFQGAFRGAWPNGPARPNRGAVPVPTPTPRPRRQPPPPPRPEIERDGPKAPDPRTYA
jgi:hypothetical protein